MLFKKKSIILMIVVVFFVLILSYLFTRSPLSDSSVKVMSYNVLADRNTWDDRLPGIVQEITASDPDVMGLQEGMSFITADLVNEIGNDYELIDFNLSNYETPIFIKKDRFIVKDHGAELAAECGIPRYVNWVLLEDGNTGKEFYVYNNHLCYEPSTSKEDQAIVLAELIAMHQSQSELMDRGVIVTGDFNSNRDSSVISYLLDQTPLNDMSSPITLVDTWGEASPNTQKPSTSSIDWILTLEGTSVLEVGVMDESQSSDHKPLTATFEFN